MDSLTLNNMIACISSPFPAVSPYYKIVASFPTLSMNKIF